MTNSLTPTETADDNLLPPRPAMVEALREMVKLGSDNPKMPESVFVQFLHQLYDRTTGKFDVALWYQTFNSHRLPVDILDPAGRVILVCPPIMGTVDTRVGVERQDSLSTLVESTQQLERRHGGLAERTLQDGLANYKEGVNHSVQAAWARVLIHYGLLAASAQATPQAQVAESMWQGDVDEV